MLSTSKSTVLISGETGTGKELFARAIHYSGERRGKPFVPVNCAALPDHLIENELFGHSKGAFTGALIEKPGLLHEADGGTLFLDEINSLSMAVQSKLLRVLQDQEFRPLGSTKSRDGRCEDYCRNQYGLALSGRDSPIPRRSVLPLERLVRCAASLARQERGHPAARQSFSQGLRERIRQEDLTLGHSAKAKLMGYAWPGNVRELQGVIQRAVAMASGETLEAHDLDLPRTRSRSWRGRP